MAIYSSEQGFINNTSAIRFYIHFNNEKRDIYYFLNSPNQKPASERTESPALIFQTPIPISH